MRSSGRVGWFDGHGGAKERAMSFEHEFMLKYEQWVVIKAKLILFPVLENMNNVHQGYFITYLNTLVWVEHSHHAIQARTTPAMDLRPQYLSALFQPSQPYRSENNYIR